MTEESKRLTPFQKQDARRMSLERRARLQKAINRLSLQKTRTARSVYGKCQFCVCDIQPGQTYKGSCSEYCAHTECITAVAEALR